MTIEKLGKGIKLTRITFETIMDYHVEEYEYQQWKILFQNNTQRFLEKIKEEDNTELLVLYLFLRLAVDQYRKYQQLNIPIEIYYDTFKDLTLWSDSFYWRYQKVGLDEYRWLILHLKLKLFKIGRLQFEMSILNEDILIDKTTLKKGLEVLEIHIPEGERLEEESCKQAYMDATHFFCKYFDKTYKYGVCSSWLLSPDIGKLLDETCNIKKFQKTFNIYKVIYPYRQAEERVFGCVREDKENYPEETSLQRKIKERVISGFDFGMGCGILETTI